MMFCNLYASIRDNVAFTHAYLGRAPVRDEHVFADGQLYRVVDVYHDELRSVSSVCLVAHLVVKAETLDADQPAFFAKRAD